MTTEKNEVTASEQNNDVTAEQKAQEIVEKVSEQVQDKVQEQVEERAEEQPKQEVDVAEIVRDTVSKEMNKLRGDQINYTAQQMKEMRQSIDENLKGYREHTEALESQRLSQMDPGLLSSHWSSNGVRFKYRCKARPKTLGRRYSKYDRPTVSATCKSEFIKVEDSTNTATC